MNALVFLSFLRFLFSVYEYKKLKETAKSEVCVLSFICVVVLNDRAFRWMETLLGKKKKKKKKRKKRKHSCQKVSYLYCILLFSFPNLSSISFISFNYRIIFLFLFWYYFHFMSAWFLNGKVLFLSRRATLLLLFWRHISQERREQVEDSFRIKREWCLQDDVSTHVFMSIDTLSLIEVMMMSILMREKRKKVFDSFIVQWSWQCSL